MVGSALSFDGIDDQVEVSHANELSFPGGNLTIEGWIKARSVSNHAIIIGKITSLEPRPGWAMYVSPVDQKLNCYIGNQHSGVPGVDWVTLSSIQAVATDQWHHAACTYNGVELKMYIDGVLNNSTIYSGGFGTTTMSLLIGNDSAPASVYGNRHYPGLADEMTLYSRPLTGVEICEIHAVGSAGKCSPAPLPDADGDGISDACDESPSCTDSDGDGICDEDSSCIEVRLSDYNLFLLEDYSLGTSIQGKVAAGGSISLTDFAVGAGLPATNISETLVAGGNLTVSRGGIWGDAWHGGLYSTDPSVVQPRGSVAAGVPIDFAARGASMRGQSTRLASLPTTGTTTREVWGGLYLRGANSNINVFEVNASDFTGAVLVDIEAPAHSLAVVNIRGASATFTGFGISLSGGIDQHGVLYNFVEATAIDAHGFGFLGTVLAPHAQITFSNGSFDGGIYARALTGNADGRLSPLTDRVVCQ